MYVINIIDTCQSYKGAMHKFISVVRGLERGSAEQQELDEVITRINLLD